MTDPRRKAAEEWLKVHSKWLFDHALLAGVDAYLAGSREEAAIKDAESAALREAARGFLELLDSKPGFFDESYLRWLGEADEAEKNLRRALEEKA